MLSIPIIAEYDGKALDRAIKDFKQLETAGEKAHFLIKKAAIPAAAALAGVAAAMGPAIKAASDLEENMSKVSVIFGDGAKEVEKFAKTAAKSMGQSQASVLQAAGTFGTFGKAAGLGGKDLATFSNKFTALASDLASFNNTTPEEAINAIGSALRGEAEPMRKFGVLLNDATLKAEAMALGIYNGSGALTDQQKILAAQSAIFKQTADAQGDFDRTSDGLANTTRTLTAQMENLQASIGKALLPAVEKVLPFLARFAAWAEKNPNTFLTIAGTITAVALAITAVNFAMAANPFTLIATGIALAVTGIAIAYTKFEGFRKVVDTVFNGIMVGMEVFIKAFNTVLNSMIYAYNLVNFGKDIPSLSTNINLPRLGGGGTEFSGVSERAGMPSTGTTTPAMPVLTAPLPVVAGGGAGSGSIFKKKGGGGGQNTIDTQGQIGDFFGGINITVNAGLVSTPGQVGQDIIAAIQKAERQSGQVFAAA